MIKLKLKPLAKRLDSTVIGLGFGKCYAQISLGLARQLIDDLQAAIDIKVEPVNQYMGSPFLKQS